MPEVQTDREEEEESENVSSAEQTSNRSKGFL